MSAVLPGYGDPATWVMLPRECDDEFDREQREREQIAVGAACDFVSVVTGKFFYPEEPTHKTILAGRRLTLRDVVMEALDNTTGAFDELADMLVLASRGKPVEALAVALVRKIAATHGRMQAEKDEA